jgi:hypothetical protein
MGWVADLTIGSRRFRVTSDRGYIGVGEVVGRREDEIPPPDDQRTKITPEQVRDLLMKATA